MTLTGFLVLLLVAGICGALGMALGGYSHGGCLLSMGLGLVGAVLGTWLAAQLNLPSLLKVTIEGRPFPVDWSILGSTIFVLLIGALRRRSV